MSDGEATFCKKLLSPPRYTDRLTLKSQVTSTDGAYVVIYNIWMSSRWVWIPEMKAALEKYDQNWVKVKFLLKSGHSVGTNQTARSLSICCYYLFHPDLGTDLQRHQNTIK